MLYKMIKGNNCFLSYEIAMNDVAHFVPKVMIRNVHIGLGFDYLNQFSLKSCPKMAELSENFPCFIEYIFNCKGRLCHIGHGFSSFLLL